jgi:hypothetical protein
MIYMNNEPFFIRDGADLIPTPAAAGPWNSKFMHGRVIVGLLGAEIERLHGDPAYMPARLTVDLYKAPDMAPVQIVTRVVRDGYRIKVIDAEMISAGKSVGRASCQLLRRTTNPPGNVWTPPDWEVTAPEDTFDPGPTGSNMMGIWSLRPISGVIGKYGQRRMWMREVREMVGGEPLTPFVRVAAGADYASPMANAGDNGLKYINSDLTIYLHRVPVGEWVGYESIHHGADDGVAVGGCYLYDEQGRIGSATTCALAQTEIAEYAKHTPPS